MLLTDELKFDWKKLNKHCNSILWLYAPVNLGLFYIFQQLDEKIKVFEIVIEQQCDFIFKLLINMIKVNYFMNRFVDRIILTNG